MLYDLLIDRN